MKPTTYDLGGIGNTGRASIDRIVAPLELTVPTSAVVEETERDSLAGASTADDLFAVTSGIGEASLCTSLVELEGREVVSTEEKETCLGFIVYRTTATPTQVPRRMASICSKTILALHLGANVRGAPICAVVKGVTQ